MLDFLLKNMIKGNKNFFLLCKFLNNKFVREKKRKELWDYINYLEIFMNANQEKNTEYFFENMKNHYTIY